MQFVVGLDSALAVRQTKSVVESLELSLFGGEHHDWGRTLALLRTALAFRAKLSTERVSEALKYNGA